MKITKRNRIEVTAVRYFSKKPFKMIIILNMTFTGFHTKKQQFILLNHMQRITVKCMKYYKKVYFIVTIESCKSLPEDVIKSQQSSCLTKMLTYRHKKSQQSICLTKMLTYRHKKSQQSSCLMKMLTYRHKKSQQSSGLMKMLT